MLSRIDRPQNMKLEALLFAAGPHVNSKRAKKRSNDEGCTFLKPSAADATAIVDWMIG